MNEWREMLTSIGQHVMGEGLDTFKYSKNFSQARGIGFTLCSYVKKTICPQFLDVLKKLQLNK